MKAKFVDRVIVSTEDADIAKVSATAGAEVPFLRPLELCLDETPGIEPVLHAVQMLNDMESYQPDYVMLLQPTSPLRSSEDIDQAGLLAVERSANAVVSVVETKEHPYWSKKIMSDGQMRDLVEQTIAYERSQDLPKAYVLNGAIYLIRREVLLQYRSFYPPTTYPYIMPPQRSLDIDTPWDLQLADLILNSSQARQTLQRAKDSRNA